MSGSTSSRGNKKVVAICQEINRLGQNLGEENFPPEERTDLRIFFTNNSLTNVDLVLNILNTIPNDNYNERLAYLKKLLPPGML